MGFALGQDSPRLGRAVLLGLMCLELGAVLTGSALVRRAVGGLGRRPGELERMLGIESAETAEAVTAAATFTLTFGTFVFLLTVALLLYVLFGQP